MSLFDLEQDYFMEPTPTGNNLAAVNRTILETRRSSRMVLNPGVLDVWKYWSADRARKGMVGESESV